MSAVKKRTTIKLNPLDKAEAGSEPKQRSRGSVASRQEAHREDVSEVVRAPEQKPVKKRGSRTSSPAAVKGSAKPSRPIRAVAATEPMPVLVEIPAESVTESRHPESATNAVSPAASHAAGVNSNRCKVKYAFRNNVESAVIMRNMHTGDWGYYQIDGVFVSLNNLQGPLKSTHTASQFLPLALVAGMLGGMLGYAAAAWMGWRPHYIFRLRNGSSEDHYVSLDHKSLKFLKRQAVVG